MSKKLISWNVNGIRAVLKKNFIDFFQDINADIFAIQETKCQAGQLDLEFPAYYQFWNYAGKKGYSGTAVFSKEKPLRASQGLNVPSDQNSAGAYGGFELEIPLDTESQKYSISQEFIAADHEADDPKWIVKQMETEGRVITLEYEDFYFVTCYTPNSQNKLKRLDNRQVWNEAFRQYLQELDKNKPVIICGDLNVAHKEIDLKNPESNHENAGFSDEERSDFVKLLDTGFTDSFRYFQPTAEDRYSWWSYRTKARDRNAGWRIDYFLVSNKLQQNLVKADILDDVLGSDHCPVLLEID